MFSAYVSTAADRTDGHKEDTVGHIVGPDVHHDKCLDFLHKGENSHKSEGHHQLSSQHQEYLEGRVDCETACSTNSESKPEL